MGSCMIYLFISSQKSEKLTAIASPMMLAVMGILVGGPMFCWGWIMLIQCSSPISSFLSFLEGSRTSLLRQLPLILHHIHLFVETKSPLGLLPASWMNADPSLPPLASSPLASSKMHLDGALFGLSSWAALSLALLSWALRSIRNLSPPLVASPKIVAHLFI